MPQGRPTRTLLKTATDQHDKAKKRQTRALEEERGLRVLLERAQREQQEATDAVAFHLDEITALERKPPKHHNRPHRQRCYRPT